MSELKYLFSPIKIKSMELANRAVMPPMGTGFGKDPTVSDGLLAYITRQSKSGAGLIIVEVTSVHPSGASGPGQVGAYDDRFIPGLKKLAAAIHDQGGKAAIQLHHAGRESFWAIREGISMAPSAIPSPLSGQAAREMTLEDINEIIDGFGQAAARAREAGFDAVELHCAHGYLLGQFLSARSNQRQDQYGGSLENRIRFTNEILREVRKRVDDDFPVCLRISTEEAIKQGYVVEDILPIMPSLVEAGADIIHASVGTHGSPGSVTTAPAEYEPGFNVKGAAKIKEVVSVPVIAVGRFSDPALADEVISRGDADMVAFGRQQLADPDYLIKAREGRAKEIRRCLACNQGCIESAGFDNIRCAINPETGQELIYPRKPAREKRRVWVVGAGPAGLTAAYEAARLGHDVELFEKEGKLGGQLVYAGGPPFKKAYHDWLDWLIRRIENSKARIQTGVRVTEEMLDEGRPEVVILAVGGDMVLPSLEGSDLPMVCDALSVLSGEVGPAGNALVVGGGLIGMETADFLLEKGCQVTVVEMLEQSPVARFAAHGYMLHKRFRAAGGNLVLGARVVRIEEGSVTVNRNGEEEVLAPVDQVVLALGMKSRDDLKTALKAKGIRHFVVGDATEARRVIDATGEGARAAWDI